MPVLLSTDLTLAMPQYVERAVKEAPCNLATWRRRERSTLNRYNYRPFCLFEFPLMCPRTT